MKSFKVKSDDGESDFENEDIAMISRRFSRFFNKPSVRKRFKDFKNEINAKDEVT